MVSYAVNLACQGREYQSVLNEPELCCQINGVQVEVEVAGSLYIETPASYPQDQLAFLNYTHKAGSLFLVDYTFQCELPVKVIEQESQRELDTSLFYTVLHDGLPHYSWQILGATSAAAEIEYAILELQEQLSVSHILACCCCCRYGAANPYGGDASLNFLCFRQNKAGYLALGQIEKKDWPYFQDTGNVDFTRPLYHCTDFTVRS